MSSVTIDTYTVFSDHDQPVNPLNGSAVVKVLTGSTVYYNDQPYVTATTNQGSLTVSQSVTVRSPVWLRSASLSSVSVTTTSSPVATVDSSGDILLSELPSAVITIDPATVAGATFSTHTYYQWSNALNNLLAAGSPNGIVVGSIVIPAGVAVIRYRLKAAGSGGGGGGSALSSGGVSTQAGGGGGSAGGLADDFLPVTPGQTLYICLGAGGLGGTAGAVNGNAGGTGGPGGDCAINTVNAIETPPGHYVAYATGALATGGSNANTSSVRAGSQFAGSRVAGSTMNVPGGGGDSAIQAPGPPSIAVMGGAGGGPATSTNGGGGGGACGNTGVTATQTAIVGLGGAPAGTSGQSSTVNGTNGQTPTFAGCGGGGGGGGAPTGTGGAGGTAAGGSCEIWLLP